MLLHRLWQLQVRWQNRHFWRIQFVQVQREHHHLWRKDTLSPSPLAIQILTLSPDVDLDSYCCSCTGGGECLSSGGTVIFDGSDLYRLELSSSTDSACTVPAFQFLTFTKVYHEQYTVKKTHLRQEGKIILRSVERQCKKNVKSHTDPLPPLTADVKHFDKIGPAAEPSSSTDLICTGPAENLHLQHIVLLQVDNFAISSKQ